MRSHLSIRILGDPSRHLRDLLVTVLGVDGQGDGADDVESVLVVVPFATIPGDLVEIEESAWRDAVDGPLQMTMSSLQEARRLLGSDGGAIVVVVPTIGFAGAASLVPITTVVEGARAMAKSAARQWAEDGISVNLLALPLPMLARELEPHTSHLLAAPGGVVETPELGRVLDTLTTASPAMTGSTIVLDGGQVMVP